MKHSITHHHLCAVINTEMQKKVSSTIRILDVGCGNGQLIVFLHHKLSQLNKPVNFQIFGFDVADSNVQTSDYFNKTISYLSEQIPTINWNERVVQITSQQEWPFPDNYFDFVISNQVMEHVGNHNFTFQQINRVLKIEGCSIHLFPIVNYIHEGHLHLPFVHRIRNVEKLRKYIYICNFLRIGGYKGRKKSGMTLAEYAERHADYMVFETNYLSKRDIFRLTKANQLKASFKYTEYFYWNKIRSIFGCPYCYNYCTTNILLESLLFSICARISSITLILKKNNTYR